MTMNPQQMLIHLPMDIYADKHCSMARIPLEEYQGNHRILHTPVLC